MKSKVLVCIVILAFILSAFISNQNEWRNLYSKPISEWPKPKIDSGIKWKEFQPLAAKDSVYYTGLERPLTQLGKLLFFDPILSGSNQISCSSCHHPDMSWGDHIPVSVGHDHLTGPRNSISLLNVRHRNFLFWDGRVRGLEQQAMDPIESPHEMAMDISKLIPKLKSIPQYRTLFKKVYGDDDFSIPEVLRALGAFQRTLISNRSRFDEFIDGNYEALTDQEIHGLHLFRTKARCMNCHHGQYLTDELFHNTGMSAFNRVEDLGRFDATKDSADIGKFRTASLRDVMNTFPWMHHGAFDDIVDILNFYNMGNTSKDFVNNPFFHKKAQQQKSIHIQDLKLNKEEILAIQSFMQSITGPKFKLERPKELPR